MKDELHIWMASLKEAEDYSQRLLASLSEQEREKGGRLVKPEHCQRYLLAHGVLRDILSRYVDETPGAIRFGKHDHGKPYLLNSDLEFNLSHSGEQLVVAVSTKGPVGVDVELTQKNHEFDDIVYRFFAEQEQREYQLYKTEESRRQAFYRAWTRKEAYLKATGLGLSYPLNQFAVSLAPDEKHCLLHDKNDTNVRTKWTVLSFDVDAHYLASLAIEAPIENFQTYTWPFESSY